jgi:16S rRNA (uracil1498-N3)-methyltransferase
MPLAAALEALPEEPERLALDPSAKRGLAELAAPQRGLVLAVGPEGGFAPADWRRLEAAKFDPVSLGRRVLRAETAAIAVCAIAQSLWGDLQR